MAGLNRLLSFLIIIIISHTTLAYHDLLPPGSYPPESTSPATLPLPEPPVSAPISFPPAASPEIFLPFPDAPEPSPSSFPPENSSPEPAAFPGSPVPSPTTLPFPEPPEQSPNLPPPSRPSRPIRAAYWPSFGTFPASDIETSYFSHIYYAFVLPEPTTYNLNISTFHQTKIPEFINALRSKTPSVKTLLSIGGGGNDPSVFSKMASTFETRLTFIKSTIFAARKYGFDGVDLDWEFPANEEDMLNLALLFQQWRKAIDIEAKFCGKPRLLLTSAVYYAQKWSFGVPRSYPTKAIRKYVDWVSPMCFDYHGSWENFTGLHSALYDPETNLDSSYGIGSWIGSGVPPKKIVMGLPLYGRTWTLKNQSDNGVGAPAVGVGPGEGVLVYSDIVDFNELTEATVVFDSDTASFYSFVDDSWIGYDDTLSINLKTRFAKYNGLGGYFFWALGQDKNWILSSEASKIWNI
ncbi:hypothetical protein UlMin_034416 [Ulmus minor]